MGKQGKKAVKRAQLQAEEKKKMEELSKSLFRYVTPILQQAQLHIDALKLCPSHTKQEWTEFIGLLDAIDLLDEMTQQHIRDHPPNHASFAAPEPTLKDLEAFEKWLVRQGVEGAGEKWGVRHVGSDQGNGVIALKELEEGDVCLKVPNTSTIATSRPGQSIAPLLASSQFFQDHATIALACQLLCEVQAGDSSQFAPYIRILPRTFGTPLFMTRKELGLMEHSSARAGAVRSVAMCVAHYRFLLAQLQEMKGRGLKLSIHPDTTFADFRWALAVASTRQNNLEDGLALVPGFDMVNHEPGVSTAEYNRATNTLELKAKRAFVAGEQLYMSYGPRSPANFLVYSGFVPANTPTDGVSVPIPMVLPLADPLTKGRLALLKSTRIVQRWQLVSEGESVEGTFAIAVTGCEAGAHTLAELGSEALLAVAAVGQLDKPGVENAMRRAQGCDGLESLVGSDVVKAAQLALRQICAQRCKQREAEQTVEGVADSITRLLEFEHGLLKHGSSPSPV